MLREEVNVPPTLGYQRATTVKRHIAPGIRPKTGGVTEVMKFQVLPGDRRARGDLLMHVHVPDQDFRRRALSPQAQFRLSDLGLVGHQKKQPMWSLDPWPVLIT